MGLPTSACITLDLLLDEDNIHGENLASNSGSGSWAEVRSTDSIVTREFIFGEYMISYLM